MSQIHSRIAFIYQFCSCLKFYVLHKNIFKVLEYVDDHGNEVLNLGSFTLLPQHVVRLILNREELKADEFSKFQVIIKQDFYTNGSCLLV